MKHKIPAYLEEVKLARPPTITIQCRMNSSFESPRDRFVSFAFRQVGLALRASLGDRGTARSRQLSCPRRLLRTCSILVVIAVLFSGRAVLAATYDIVIYGGTSAGVIAAVQAKRMGKSVIIVSPDQHLGGLTSNGLGFTDTGNKAVIGGLPQGISPYVVPGDPSSGVLPRISTEPPGEYGSADQRVQAYCYRVCLTDVPANRVPFPKPDGYDPGQYELLLRIFNAGWRETFQKFDPIPNHKTDTNNHGPMSTDNIGMNYDYPDASYERRREILKEHETYEKGWFYFIANDPRVPAEVREQMNRWGLAKDEFTDNGNWPHQIYVREARRMIGQFVMTENELMKRRPTPESIGMGSYGIDSHNVQRYITTEGFVQNEGDIGVGLKAPYEIAYGSLVPKKAECENLLVPVCVSASHIAYGSIRMEPVFIILGQSAATAAAIAIDDKEVVQDVNYSELREKLLKDGQVLQFGDTTK